MSTYRLAQINLAKMPAPLSDPKMSGYVELLREVNTLAEGSPGFVWRLDEANAVAGDRLFPGQPPGTVLVNLSIWKSVGALRRYVQFGLNEAFIKARRSWFRRFEGRWVVLWWVPDGHFPVVAEGWERLQHLRKHGETGYAFNLVRTFPPPPEEQDYLSLPSTAKPARPHIQAPQEKPMAARRIAPPVLPWYLDW